MGAFLARSQHNSSILYICVQWIARADIEAAAKRPWKNDLSLGRHFSLHGMTILPCEDIDSYTNKVGRIRDLVQVASTSSIENSARAVELEVN